jgi:DNA topoisomerase-2
MPKTVEEKYKKYSQIEHVLARPGMYIGDIQNVIGSNWVVEDDRVVSKQLHWNPGIYKIFDEIITNAADESQRNEAVKNINVSISNDTITVENDGAGIPIDIHKEYKIYVPELIFANLLSSSNYDDSEKRTVGGLNGLGAKLTNIYSTEFTVETADGNKKYVQTYKNNLSVIEKPTITKSTKNYTKITFKPDFEKFGMKQLDNNDTYKILERRVYDICAVTNKNVAVSLNGKKLKTKDFSQYMDLYLGPKKDAPRVYEEVSSRWAIGFALSPSETFQQISFVNGISTIDGGSHIEHVIGPVIKKITEELQAKHKNINIKPQYVRDHLFVFVKCLIENPNFSSQTKEKNTTKVSEFGSRCNVSEDTIKKISKLGFVDQLLAMAEAKEKKAMSKTDGKKISRIHIPKLDDANRAGTSDSEKCTLILTEGDSAKTTAVSGLSVVGRDYFGVFPLRGKLLNTRTASFAQISKNEEINNIKKILGLQTGTKYSNLKGLRYGKIMVMTDQDTDGFHIKSLLINFIDAEWPDLLKNHVFIESLLTPIVKVSRRNETLQFYNIPDYEEWRKNSSNNWKIKYYKGLGTSTATEAKEYFKSMKTVGYTAKSKTDRDAIELAFKKTEADSRKDWILSSTKNFKSLDYKQKVISVESLIKQELVLFSIQDNVRSLPSFVDGLKPSQRKILFSCFKKKPTKNSEIKVSQLSGYVSEQSSYHHGEASLMETIINMAQNFVGSNNMNLLHPSGQFGTRLMGGKDASSPRYIFTYLSENIDKLFNPHDLNLLEYLDDDGQSIEPRFYVPKLPLVLINGSQGIGTGFSTSIPCFNPDDLKQELIEIVKNPDHDIKELTPWYKGFTGEIVKIDENKWLSIGKYTIDNYTVTVTELPIGTWTEDYKQFLEKLEQEDKIHCFKNMSTEERVCFEIKVKLDTLNEWRGSIEKLLKLTSNINAQNMHLFNEKGEIVKMHSAEEILWNFYKIRNEYNIRRKKYLIKTLEHETNILSSQVRFLEMIIKEELVIFRKKKDIICKELEQLKFYKNDNSYDYLLDMNIHSFTEEKIDSLTKKMNDKQLEYEKVKNMTIRDIWLSDLN